METSRRRSRLLATTCGLLLVTGWVLGSCAARSHPNVLIVIADDLGWADVGYHGSPIRTPHIDALAESGVRLERFYAHAWCVPTRESLMLGHPEFTAARDVGPSLEPRTTGVTPEHETLARRFQDAGYETALVGKWHLGTSDVSHPNRNGFGHFYGLLGGFVDFYTKLAIGEYDWQRNGETVSDARYATELLGSEAVRFIAERDASRPFFLVLSFNAVHFPVQAPPEAIASYRESEACRETPTRCAYMAQATAMDFEIGRVLAALGDARDDTLVVFMSDNGGDESFLGRGENAPLRGQKGTTYEGGVRVVAAMSWKGVLEPGVNEGLMRVSDLYATLERAADLERRAPESSRDLWEPLRSGTVLEREPFVFSIEDRERAVIHEGWKLHEDLETGATQLFRLDDDPYERSNVAESHPEVVASLRRSFVPRH